MVNSDVVINLAAEHHDDVTPRSLYDDVNVKGAENVCNICTKLGIKRIIFTSSVTEYGFAPIGSDESGKINFLMIMAAQNSWQKKNIVNGSRKIMNTL